MNSEILLSSRGVFVQLKEDYGYKRATDVLEGKHKNTPGRTPMCKGYDTEKE